MSATNTAKPMPNRPMFGACGFHPDDHVRMPDDAWSLDEWQRYLAAVQQQKDELSEAHLIEDAKDLIESVSNHWCYGMFDMAGLGDLAKEKLRRLRAANPEVDDPYQELATWFARLGVDSYGSYQPTADDCYRLVNNFADRGSSLSGSERPGFFDEEGE